MWGWLAAAHAADTLDSSVLLGMGRVGLASSAENAAITLNPGLLPLRVRYDFQGQFRYGPDGGMTWGASAVDGRTSPKIAGGIAYCGDRSEPPLRVSELPGWAEPDAEIPNVKRHHDVALGIGVPFADRKVGFGIGANVGYFDNDRQGSGWLVDGYVGLGVHPVEPLTIGLSLRDFLPLETVEDRPLELGGGVRFDAKHGPSLEGDAIWLPDSTDDVPLTFAAGIDGGFDALGLRAGWRRDGLTGDHAVTAGLGIGSEGAALEYAVLVPLIDGLGLEDTVHQLSLRFAAPEDIPIPD